MMQPSAAPQLIPNCLLAKSYSPGHWKGSYSLVGHTADVVNAVTILVETLDDRLVQQFGLRCDLTHLKATARLAAYLHDWGKANDHFQAMVRAKVPGAYPQRNVQEQPQMLRHEVLSALLAWEFRDWLRQGEGDLETAIAAAGGHHLKLGGRGGRKSEDFGEIRQSGDPGFYVYLCQEKPGKRNYHPLFKTLLRYGVKSLGLPKKVSLAKTPPAFWGSSEVKAKRQALRDHLSLDWQGDPTLVAVIKALVIAGDSSGSAFAQVDRWSSQKTRQWIEQELQVVLDQSKLQRVINDRLQGNKPRPFQIQLGEVQSRVSLARAGCGTGKTLGAYKWAQKHALGRKLFFCYPTTGTSTEGFIDYVHGKLEAELFHSRSHVDLAMMTTGEEEELEVHDGTLSSASETEVPIKLDSFRAWGAEVAVCTVDTVLGLFQCNRRPLYCFPAIANAAFVFDEIHCYDSKLFGTLLRFLEVVKAPILLMSASVLPWQKTAIEAAVGEPIETIQGPRGLEEQPRYRFRLLKSPDWDRVKAELSAGGKVLWVCNQVNTAVDVYKTAKAQGLPALLYHSRYRYGDRVDHHRSVVDQFKGDRPILAVTTQVAEMSLDLSATLLVSQTADPAGLIQRLGRLNRRYCGHALEALFYSDAKPGFPYSDELLQQGQTMLQHFTGDVSQVQLAQWLETSTPEPRKHQEDVELVLLDGEWRTYSASLREESHSVTAVLEQDLPKLKTLPAKEIPSYTVPLPNQGSTKWPKYKFYPVAPAETWSYSAEFGARKQA